MSLSPGVDSLDVGLTAEGSGQRLVSFLLVAAMLTACQKEGEPTSPAGVASVEVVPDVATVEVGRTRQLEAVLRDGQGNVISGGATNWTSSDVAVATVDASGVVTGVAVGEATIEATADGVPGAAEIRVVPDVLNSLALVYAVLRGTQWAYYNLSELTTDEMIVPIRGSEWVDNGKWLEMHRHTWTANSPSGLDDVDSVWTDAFAGVARANVLLDQLEHASVPDQVVIEAELRTLRAFYYYMLLDMFGGVPIVTMPEGGPQPRNTRAEVFHFVVEELSAALPDLPDNWPVSDYARMTKGAADAMLSSTYLNAGVFTLDVPSANAYNSCTGVQVGGQSACDAAIAAADRVLNGGQYSLATDWHSNFAPDNFASPENILVVENLNQAGLGLDFVMRALHYNQLSPSPWNGFAALAETYNAFDADDQRREIFLEGSQVNLDTGEPATDRQGNPLVFTVDIVDETQAGEGEGARLLKWPPDPDRVAQNNGNDFAYFRLAEILLIKAEALNELTPGSGEAVALLNTLRERVFEPDEPLASLDRGVILHERLLELAGEAKRRQDLIRHGRFTEAWSFKQPGAPHLVLMPIPQSQLDANPLLTQNPGY